MNYWKRIGRGDQSKRAAVDISNGGDHNQKQNDGDDDNDKVRYSSFAFIKLILKQFLLEIFDAWFRPINLPIYLPINLTIRLFG